MIDYGMLLFEEMLEEKARKTRAITGGMLKTGLLAFPLTEIPAIGPLISMVLGAVVGDRIEKRVNSFKYQCEKIQDPAKRQQCQLTMIKFMMTSLKSALQKSKELTPKQTKRIHTALGKYEEQYTRIKYIHPKEFKENTIEEAATGGWWKTMLGGGPVMMVAASRINKLAYHCNQFKDDKYKYNECRLKVVNEIERILKSHKGDTGMQKRLDYLNKVKSKIQSKLG